MSICIFYYDGFCEFEVVLCALQFKGNYVTAALENRIYISEERQKFIPDRTIDELNLDEIDLFIIPGGNPAYLYNNIQLKDFIKELNSKNKLIAGICAGTYLMASYGLLENKRCTGASSGIEANGEYIDLFKNSIIVKDDVVVDCNTITSTGQGFIEFALQLCKMMQVYPNDDEAVKAYKWFKNLKF